MIVSASDISVAHPFIEQILMPVQFSGEELVASLSRQPNNAFFSLSSGRIGLLKVQPMSHRYEDPNDSWFEVEFDSECKVVAEAITLPYKHLDMIEVLKKCVAVALQVMGTKMHWGGTKQLMGMSILCHQNLQKDEKAKGIDWHKDASDVTMVVLLDDAEQWEGGDFEYRDLLKDTVTPLKPQQNKGVLFSNDQALHRLLPFKALKDGVNRTILTLHSKARSSL
jgi:hypothetical protein